MKSSRYFSRKKKLGLAVLVFLTLWNFFIAPALIRLPSDFNFSAEITSVDNFYEEDLGDFSGEQFSKTHYSYETVSSDSNTSVIKNIFEVKTLDDEPIFAVERLYGIDRFTGAHVAGLGDEEREGYLFAPKNLQKGEPFTYWHINYDGPAKMEYMGTEFLYGLYVYHYQSNYEGVNIDQTANLTYLPEVGVTKGIQLDPHLELWVEPTTGRLVKYTDDTTAYYYDLATGARLHPWNHFHNTINEESVEKIVNDLNFELTKQNVINLYVPILLLFLGLYFLFSETVWVTKLKKFLDKDRVTFLIGLFPLCISALVLAGWMTHQEALIRIFPSSAAMHPFTAINFILISLGLIGYKRLKKIRFLGVITIAFYCLVLLDGLIPLNVNEWLFRNEIIEFNAHIPFVTAILFILLGTSLTLHESAWAQRFSIVQINSATSLIVGLNIFFGYLFKPLGILDLPFFFSTGMHTALLFILLGATMFFFFSEENKLNFRNNALILGILFATLLGTISFTTLVERTYLSESRSRFLDDVEATTVNISNQLKIDTNILAGARGLFSASKSVEREEWKSYVDSLNLAKNYPGVQGIGYAVMLDPADLEAHIAAVQSEGFGTYTVRPEGDREQYSAIVYIEPFDERNQKAFGFDMYQEPNRRLAMELSRDIGNPKMSARITLVQETDPKNVQAGFLIYLPIYQNGASTTTLEEKRAALLGYVYSPFRAENFINSIIGDSGLENIGLKITDGTDSENPDAVLYDDQNEKVSDVNEARFTTSRTIYSNGRPWVLNFQSTANYGATLFNSLLPILTFLLGLCVSFLISGIVYVILNSRQNAVTYADRVTKQLKGMLEESIQQKTELENFNKIMVGRELKMIELKERLKKYEPKPSKNTNEKK